MYLTHTLSHGIFPHFILPSGVMVTLLSSILTKISNHFDVILSMLSRNHHTPVVQFIAEHSSNQLLQQFLPITNFVYVFARLFLTFYATVFVVVTLVPMDLHVMPPYLMIWNYIIIFSIAELATFAIIFAVHFQSIVVYYQSSEALQTYVITTLKAFQSYAETTWTWLLQYIRFALLLSF